MTKFASLTLLAWACLAPVVLAQEPACEPDRWKADIAAFEDADKADPPPRGGIVFVGSSSIRMWDLPQSFPDAPVINRGFGGSELCDSVHYFDALVARHDPRVVVLYAGDNDVANGKKAKQIHSDFRAFVGHMREKLPRARLVFISIKPSPARWELAAEMRKANEIIATDCQADSARLYFVDVWPPMLGPDGEPRKDLFLEDGLHLNDEGYALWATLLEEPLKADQR